MLLLYGLALLAGLASAVEPGQNASLAERFGHPLLAGTVSVAISFLTLVAILLAARQFDWPSLDQAAQAPWWAWFGGVLSVFLALAQLYVAKRLGAAPFLCVIVTAGVATSVVLDQYGLVGFAVHEASAWRLAGGALMIVGVLLVAAF